MSAPTPMSARAAKTIFPSGLLDPLAPKPLRDATSKTTRPSKAPRRKTSMTNRRFTLAERRFDPHMRSTDLRLGSARSFGATRLHSGHLQQERINARLEPDNPSTRRIQVRSRHSRLLHKGDTRHDA